MKNYNNKKSIMERGGLMIEALAMLGLIAVVTPTMYKSLPNARWKLKISILRPPFVP